MAFTEVGICYYLIFDKILNKFYYIIFFNFRYLIETLDTTLVKPDDVKLVLEVVAANPEGRLLAWRHLKAYWPTMHSLYGNSTILMGNLISAVTAHLSTPYDLYEVNIIYLH